MTKVTAVTETFGILNSPAIPARVFLAAGGKAGDSGALVTETGTGLAVGLYIADYRSAAGSYGGIAQNAEQIVQMMDMELYL